MVKKQFSEKLKLLKDIASGRQSLSKLMKPKWITVFVRGEEGKEERTYEIDREEYNQQEYDKWKEGVDESSTILHFLEIVNCRGKDQYGNEPLTEDRPIMVPVEVKVVQLPEEKEIVQQKTEPCVEAVIEPRLIPMEEHIRYNEMIFDKLFS